MTPGERRSRRGSRIYRGLLAVQSAAILVGAAFALLGILGFIPGVTTGLDDLHWVGSHSGAAIFGVFQVSLLQNLIHIALGLAGILLSRTFALARWYLLGGGLICVGLGLLGMLIDPHGTANALALNSADNWLHFGAGITMIVLGLTLAGTRVPTGAGGEVLLPPD